MNKSCFEEVCSRLRKLAQRNETMNQLPELEEFVRKNFDLFPKDYASTSHEKRYSTGKLEGELFLKLASLCNFKNRDDNAREASDMFRLLGYESYKQNPKRFRQKIENYKKKQKSLKGKYTPNTHARKTTRRRELKERALSVASSSEVDDNYSPSVSSDTETISTNSREESITTKPFTESPKDESTELIKDLERDSYSDPLLDQPLPWNHSDSNSPILPGGDLILLDDVSSTNPLFNTDLELAIQEKFAEEHKNILSTIFNNEDNHNSTFSDNTDVYMYQFYFDNFFAS